MLRAQNCATQSPCRVPLSTQNETTLLTTVIGCCGWQSHQLKHLCNVNKDVNESKEFYWIKLLDQSEFACMGEQLFIIVSLLYCLTREFLGKLIRYYCMFLSLYFSFCTSKTPSCPSPSCNIRTG